MVVLDASFVLLLIDPEAKPPTDPSTGKVVEKSKERIEYLIAQLSKAKDPVIVPAPALAEFLVRAGSAATRYLQELQNERAIRIEPFAQRAAIECAHLIDGAKKAGKRTKPGETWAKVKFDRQIIARAKVVEAKIIYTTDENLMAVAAANGLNTIAVYDLPLPPVDSQPDLPFDPASDE